MAGGAYAVLKFGTNAFKKERNDLLFHKVQKEVLEVTIVEKGQLEAAENRDVFCQVKATKGGNFSTTIKWVIDDGTPVKKGEKLVELDRSSLEDQQKAQQSVVDKSRADVVTAEGQLEIVKSENDSALSKAQIDLDLAILDLEKYIEGEYPSKLNDVKAKVKKAESDMEMIRERASWSERMVMKKMLSSTQSDAEQNRLMGAELDLSKLRDDQKVLTVFEKKREETFRKSDVAEKRRIIDRVKTQNKAKLNTAESDLKTKKSLLEQEEEKLTEIKDQIGVCTIYAPQDGLAVYFVPEQAMRGGGSQQSIIAQGEPVREGQKLLRIPNLDHMLVSTRVHEAMVRRVEPGMRVDVRVEAMQDRILRGKVKFVSSIAMQQDWRSSSDVKMYQAMISIVESVPGLRPGMSAVTTTHVDAANGPVLTVPIQAIIGGAELGDVRTLYVKQPDGSVEPRNVELGLSNEKMAEVKTGLKEGDEVVMNPKVLLGDKAKTRNPADFEKKNNGQGNGNGQPSGDTKGGATKGPGAAIPGGPGAVSPGAAVPGAAGPGAGGPGAGGPGGPGGGMKWDPKMLQDPAVQKKMREMGIDPNNFDPSKMKGKGKAKGQDQPPK